MIKAEIETATQEILELFLGHAISEETGRASSSEWDSLKHMQIIFALEERFGLQFSEEEIPLLNSYGEIVQSLIKKHES